MNVFLTQYDGAILGPIAKVLGYILEGIYSFFSMFGIYNTGLCIIFFTFIVNGLMIPLTLKQQKFSKLNSLMAPEIQEIQAKYKNKKDQESIQKMQMEQQAVYNKYGVSPTAGCLPMLITLPIFFALYRVIYNVPAYVPQIKEIYEGIITTVSSSGVDLKEFVNCIASFVKNSGIDGTFTNADLSLVTSQSLNGVDNIVETLINGIQNGVFNTESSNYIVDILSQFRAEHWSELLNMDIIKSNPGIASTVSSSYEQLKGIYSFLGMNIMETPAFTNITIIVPILAVVTQFISNKIVMSGNTNANSENDPTANSMKTMNNIMPFMSGIFCFMFPIGVGLYWVAGSLFRIIQGLFINLYFDKVGIEAIAAKNIEKRNKKLEKKGIDPNSTKMQSIANTRTSSIKTTANYKNNSSSKNKNSRQEYYVNRNINKNSSIADIANMLNSNYECNNGNDEMEE